MRRPLLIVIAVIAVIVVAFGGFAAFKMATGGHDGNSGSSGQQGSGGKGDGPGWFHGNWDLMSTAPMDPPCQDGPVLTRWPAAISDTVSIPPLGRADGNGHTIPLAHMNVAVTPLDSPQMLDGAPITTERVPLVFPSDGTVTGLMVLDWKVNATGDTYQEVSLAYHVCGTKVVRMAHLDDVPASILDAAQQGGRKECNDGGGSQELSSTVCMYSGLAIPVKAGDPLGVASGRAAGFDIGVMDASQPNDWINMERLAPEWQFGKCPLDWFPADVTAQLASLSERGGSDPCGRLAQDKAGTPAGTWWAEAQGRPMDEARALALTEYALDPGDVAITVGYQTQVPGVQSGAVYHAKAGTSANRPFSEVPDGTVACYDNLVSSRGESLGKSIVLMSKDRTLSIGALDDATCPASPALPANVATMHR